MYLLRCPNGHEIPVAASAAGGTVVCPECGQPQSVPKLGELRQLPRVAEEAPAAATASVSFGSRVAFAALMFIALGAAVSATFAAFRWQSLPVPMTIEDHIEGAEREIGELSADQLVEVWAQYEHYQLVERQPYPYQILANLRAHWRRIFLISLGIAVLCVLLAIATAWVGRSRRHSSDT